MEEVSAALAGVAGVVTLALLLAICAGKKTKNKNKTRVCAANLPPPPSALNLFVRRGEAGHREGYGVGADLR